MMDIQSVTDAKKLVADLRHVLPAESHQFLTQAIEKAFSELMGVKGIIEDPLPVDANGRLSFKSIDEAISRYVDERDALRVANAAFDRQETEAKDRMDRISMWLRDLGDQLGVDSFKTSRGTAYRNVKTAYRMGDWDAFVKWMDETKNFQCVEKRVSKLATKEIHDHMSSVIADIDKIPDGPERQAAIKGFEEMFHMKFEDSGVPPGVNYEVEVTFDVRRPTASTRRGASDE